jgi:glycosyltransferase involved in cell wall biosynthesis
MRIACVNHHRQIVGGTETYLCGIIPGLQRRGHEVSLWHEARVAAGAAAIPLSAGMKVCCLADTGVQAAIERLRKWQPDVIFCHGLQIGEWEASLPAISPVVHFAHNYYGTCISGHKTRMFPVACPCDRRFGSACLLQYLPRRCGGLNPITMVHEYRAQSRRLDALRLCSAIVTASSHMREEYLKHGLSADKVFQIALFSEPSVQDLTPRAAEPYRLLFCGRMIASKGGGYLLEALPAVQAALGRPVQVTFAGDGPKRRIWETRGKALQRRHEGLEIHFTGWIPQDAVRKLATEHDLLVIPSIWPEPFGLVGLEMELPSAAFDVGGIKDWLDDGVNGHLAAGNPPTSAGLADAILRCLADRRHHASLRRGAREAATRFSLHRHVSALLPVLESVCRTPQNQHVR